MIILYGRVVVCRRRRNSEIPIRRSRTPCVIILRLLYRGWLVHCFGYDEYRAKTKLSTHPPPSTVHPFCRSLENFISPVRNRLNAISYTLCGKTYLDVPFYTSSYNRYTTPYRAKPCLIVAKRGKCPRRQHFGLDYRRNITIHTIFIGFYSVTNQFFKLAVLYLKNIKLFSKLCSEIYIFNDHKIIYKNSYTLIRNKSNN